MPKSHARCEAYGTLDEAISFMGLARSLALKDETREMLLGAQKDLFTVNGELATEPGDYARFCARFKPVTEEMAGRLEKAIMKIEGQIKIPEVFIIPGSNAGAAATDVARAVVRRAERRVVALRESGDLKNDAILHYLNRLADLLFILARYEEA